jgi:hypothetical protein
MKEEQMTDDKMKTKSVKVLPKTAAEIENGGVYSQRVRCGKDGCKCARGETHTAYYFFTRRNKKLIKIYIRKAELSSFLHIVNKAKAEKVNEQRVTKADLDLLKEMREILRDQAAMINTLKGK